MITLTVPLPPNMANSRRHWRVVLKDKQAYRHKLAVLSFDRGFPQPPKTPMQRARLSATLYVHNPMDDDNALARLKHFIDWLVSAGYLAGDSRKHIEWEGLPHQVIDRKNPRCVLTLTPIAA